ASAVQAQFPLQSADGTSGLLAGKDAGGLVNYEASESRVGFKFVTGNAPTDINKPLITYIFDAGFSANKSQRDLFKGGSFTPGYDFAFTTAWTFEKKPTGYRQLFVRAIADSAAQKTVTADGSTLKLDSSPGTTVGGAGGYNHAFTENVVW